MKCWKEPCVEKRPLYAVSAVGYPAPMGWSCGDHLAEFFDGDLAHPGSTASWVIEVVPC